MCYAELFQGLIMILDGGGFWNPSFFFKESDRILVHNVCIY